MNVLQFCVFYLNANLCCVATGMNIWLAVFSVAVVAILYTVLVSICISNSIFVSYNINNTINSNATN